MPILTIELIHDISAGFCLLWYSETPTPNTATFFVMYSKQLRLSFGFHDQKSINETWQKKHLRKSDIDRGMKYSMTSYLRQSKANH